MKEICLEMSTVIQVWVSNFPHRRTPQDTVGHRRTPHRQIEPVEPTVLVRKEKHVRLGSAGAVLVGKRSTKEGTHASAIVMPAVSLVMLTTTLDE
jgi:hypothetical protein